MRQDRERTGQPAFVLCAPTQLAPFHIPCLIPSASLPDQLHPALVLSLPAPLSVSTQAGQGRRAAVSPSSELGWFQVTCISLPFSFCSNFSPNNPLGPDPPLSLLPPPIYISLLYFLHPPGTSLTVFLSYPYLGE